ncbi:MAG: siroheme synthase CysG [Pseudomonadota bacterium]
MMISKHHLVQNTTMRYFPVFLDLQNAHVIIVGGAEQAAQKLRLILKTNVAVTLIAPQVCDEIADLEANGRITILRRAFAEQDVIGTQLVYAATEDEDLAKQVHEAAKANNIPVNVVDQQNLCTFLTPAIVDRSPVTVAIGTEGAAPVLAREIKAEVDRWLPANYGKLASFAQKLRNFLAKKITNGRLRRIVWQNLLYGQFRRSVLSENFAEARKALKHELNTAQQQQKSIASNIGSVALIGCGPGDPSLLTLKAQQRMQDADVLVIDRLVNPEILEYARRDAHRIYVGKTPGKPSTSQVEINRILLAEALKGNTVARLKGGDPFVFGRASEEMMALQPHGVPVEIVPGITAAHACAASIALPVTMRETHRSFSILTGATIDGVPEHDWQMLAKKGQAFAIYMGVRTSSAIKQKLQAAGIDTNTPVVLVENGTRENERALATTIENLDICVKEEDISGPTIIFVGVDWSDVGLERPDKVKLFQSSNVIQFSGNSKISKLAI